MLPAVAIIVDDRNWHLILIQHLLAILGYMVLLVLKYASQILHFQTNYKLTSHDDLRIFICNIRPHEQSVPFININKPSWVPIGHFDVGNEENQHKRWWEVTETWSKWSTISQKTTYCGDRKQKPMHFYIVIKITVHKWPRTEWKTGRNKNCKSTLKQNDRLWNKDR